MRLLGVLVILVILAIGGLVGYSYFGDMSARTRVMSVPVPITLPENPPPAGVEPEATDSGSEPATDAQD